MMDIVEIIVRREALAHTGFLLVALAFIVRDPLALHFRAVVAYCLFVGFASSAPGGPIWHLIGWYVVFLAINGGQVARLVHERHFDRLSAKEKSLIKLAFPALGRCAAKRLIRRGHWMTLRAGDLLTEQGQSPKWIYAILEGRIQVSVNGARVCDLGPGQFVGEIGFVNNGTATATTVVASDGARVLAWNQCRLRRDAGRSGELRGAIFAALGADLARKTAEQTVRVSMNNEPCLPPTAEFAGETIGRSLAA